MCERNGVSLLQAIAAMSGTSVRLHDVVKCYDGVGDVSTWLKKFELVAKMRGVEKQEEVLPLFLEGPAFAIYEHLSDADKGDLAKIKKALVDAFAMDAFSAFDQLKMRSLQDGESVDVYMAELRKLAALAGVSSDNLLRCSFVTGLPKSVSAQIRATARVECMELDSLVRAARTVVSEVTPRTVHVEVAAARVENHRQQDQNKAKGSINTKRELKCFQCGGPHFKQWCPQIMCHQCGKTGHMSKNCSATAKSVNDCGEPCAPAASL